MDPPTTNPFRPTRVFRIKNHNSFSGTIKILDVTPYMTLGDQTAEELHKAAGAAAKRATPAPAPYLTIKRPGFWSTRFVASTASRPDLAKLKLPKFLGATHIDFAPGTAHASHPLSMAQKGPFSREEIFVLDSAPYRWAMDSNWHSRRMTLRREVQAGAGTAVCARSLLGYHSWDGATVLVDAREIDEVVALLTAVVMGLKVKQRESG